MDEVNKDTYVLTIENDAEKTIIKSLQKGEKKLDIKDGIDLDNEQNAIEQLNSAINPATQVAEQAVDIIPQPLDKLNNENQQEEKQKLLETQLTGNYANYNLQGLLTRLMNRNPASHKEERLKLAEYINENLNSGSWVNADGGTADGDTITNDIIKSDPGKVIELQQIQKGKFQVVLGGNHHTRKRTHKPRNIKSNTRKGHIYRKNRRRTHGKSSAHGKKQTRRIANR